jgi:hypothetical protein
MIVRVCWQLWSGRSEAEQFCLMKLSAHSINAAFICSLD